MQILIMGPPTSNGLKCFGINNEIYGGGWVENLIKKLSNISNIEISSCFYSNFVKKPMIKKYENIKYIVLPVRVKGLEYCNDKMVEDLKYVFSTLSPDIVHIIGTEREHDLKMLEIAGINRSIVSITGMVSYCALHYYAGIDEKNFKIKSIGDVLRNGGPIKERKNFIRYGFSEKQLIKKAKYIMGRTTWDYACVKQLNSDVEYIYCSEVLNQKYFENRWNLKKVKKHSIFVSQASYPLKGFHQLLMALPIILMKYPDTEVYVAGTNLFKNNNLMDKVKHTTYSKHLMKLIKKLKIPKNKIHFTGQLDSNRMLEQYLKANVFVLPSAIENSPNSLGEAMLLGVPCVASCVGGIQDMITDKENGFIYSFDEFYMLAFYICKIFENDDLAIELGKRAHESALIRFNVNEIVNTTIKLYEKVFKEKDNYE